jgi:predicted PurR-regulated permease PerM
MADEDIKVASRSNSSQRIIALGIVFGFLYIASSLVMILLAAVLLAYFLDPCVELLERMHIPRALGALIIVLVVIAMVGGLGYLVVDRTDQFLAAWPRYSAVLRHAATTVDRKLANVEKQVALITPEEEKGRATVRVADKQPVRELLVRGVGSLYSILLVTTFVPFLVLFMLAGKRHIWHATLDLFPAESQVKVQEALHEVSVVLRSYLVGNALVALIVMLGSWAFFLAIHLDYPFLTGCVSGALNMVPYLGAVLSWLPPFVIGMAQWRSVGPYVGIAALLSFFHLIANNVLTPAIVGRRVHLNAAAVTIALLFWGWMWGAFGLILAIPITATIRVICEHVDGWEPAGRWLGGVTFNK